MRSRVIFLLALVMGVITTALLFQYLQQSSHSQEVIVVEETTEVVVAMETISEKQIITEDMLKVVELPTKTLHPNVIIDIDDVVGKFSTSIIEKDEILLTHRINSELEEKQFVSRKIRDGLRAISIEAGFFRSVSNLIEPEDYVDVIFSEEVDEEIKTEIILTEVRVLAVGRKIKPPTSEEHEYVEYSSVTLELGPKDAATLVNASERGSIYFILHSSINVTEE